MKKSLGKVKGERNFTQVGYDGQYNARQSTEYSSFTPLQQIKSESERFVSSGDALTGIDDVEKLMNISWIRKNYYNQAYNTVLNLCTEQNRVSIPSKVGSDEAIIRREILWRKEVTEIKHRANRVANYNRDILRTSPNSTAVETTTSASHSPISPPELSIDILEGPIKLDLESVNDRASVQTENLTSSISTGKKVYFSDALTSDSVSSGPQSPNTISPSHRSPLSRRYIQGKNHQHSNAIDSTENSPSNDQILQRGINSSPESVKSEIAFSNSNSSAPFLPRNKTKKDDEVDLTANDDDNYSFNDNLRRELKYESKQCAKVKSSGQPMSSNLLKELRTHRKDLNELMREILKLNSIQISLEKRIHHEELLFILKGFNALDCDSDGLITTSDLIQYYSNRGLVLSNDEVKELLWPIDDKRQGYLTLDNIQGYCSRLSESANWISLESLVQYAHKLQEISKKQKLTSQSQSERKLCKEITQPLKYIENMTSLISNSMHMYRLISYAALEGKDNDVHLISAVESLVGAFGAKIADRMFERTFSISSTSVRDDMLCSLKTVENKADELKQLFLPSLGIISKLGRLRSIEKAKLSYRKGFITK